MPKISVIVPVHNARAFLCPCIDSILAQTLNDLEIILIDDGSIDDSPAICDRYAAQDARVICIHQENAGAAVARNQGLKVASGEYIAFCFKSGPYVSMEGAGNKGGYKRCGK